MDPPRLPGIYRSVYDSLLGGLRGGVGGRQGNEVDCTGRERRRANVKIVASEPTLGATAYVGGGGAAFGHAAPAAAG